jgi:hypothetical protein
VSTLTNSLLHVSRRALAVATPVLRPYAHRFSPKLCTQPQLFVCLVLKTSFKTDYRGVCSFSRGHADRFGQVLAVRQAAGNVTDAKQLLN